MDSEQSAESKSSQGSGGVWVLLALIGGAALITLIAEGGITDFLVVVLMAAFPSLIIWCAWNSAPERPGLRVCLLLASVGLFALLLQRMIHELADRNVRLQQALSDAQRWQAWYQSLTPYEKLQVDKRQMEEENQKLRQQLNSSD